MARPPVIYYAKLNGVMVPEWTYVAGSVPATFRTMSWPAPDDAIACAAHARAAMRSIHVAPPDGVFWIEIPTATPPWYRRIRVQPATVTDDPWTHTATTADIEAVLSVSAAQGSQGDPCDVIGAPKDHPGGPEMWLEILRDGLGDCLAGDVLDLGCGPGRVCRIVAPVARSVIGVDISSHVLAAAKDASRWPVPGNVRYLLGDGMTIADVPDASCDAIYSMFVFQHLTPLRVRAAYLTEARRVLRPGGRFLLQTKILGNGMSWWFDHADDLGVDVSWSSPDEAERVLRTYGWHVVQQRVQPGNQEPGGLWLWSVLTAP